MDPLPIKDIEAISAYIDQALSPWDTARLEERLRKDPALMAELESMRQTRAILKSVPQFKSPRNFTLTPNMIGEASSRRRSLFPVARLAFVLTSFMFVITFAGNFVFQPAPAAAPQAESLAVRTIEEAETVLEDTADLDAASQESAAAEALPAAPDDFTAEEPEILPVDEPEVIEVVEVELPVAEEAVEEGAPVTAEVAIGGGGPASSDTGESPDLAPTPEAMKAIPTAADAAHTESTAADTVQVESEEDAAADQNRVETLPPVDDAVPDAPAAAPVAETAPIQPPGRPAPNYWLIAAVLSGAAALLSGVWMVFSRKN